MSKTFIEQEQEKESAQSKLVGIRTNDNESASLNAIVFITETLSTALPRHDFVKIEYGEEIGKSILITTRDHLIELEGQRLDRLFDLLALNRVFSIEEGSKQDKPEDRTSVIKITIANLEDLKDEQTEDPR